MTLTSIIALQDNYIWVLNNDNDQCLMVDPSDAIPVLDLIAKKRWKLKAILLTHHHYDHIGGVLTLLTIYPDLIVFGPPETSYYGANILIQHGDNINILDMNFRVIGTPGHTLGHVSYFSYPYLFCGDTLFSAGCGKIFEGTSQQMFESLKNLNRLPEDTLICGSHEYTLSNLTFAHALYPEDSDIRGYYYHVKELRTKNIRTLPTTLAHERKINIFLRTKDIELQKKITINGSCLNESQIFKLLRYKKDQFQEDI
ncbi:hydroxyacylglutathione hydrolase [Candidatus Erwinia haradaeae]|uniref:Hydroxyacylglutathione hydrolase n=1 Tax=Candidatus Erwinia haradaeae TaxID=1922217 RepID=A0A451DIB4_9GAMM|nr:hydroxyacylglutathione hydrolase [Candidatus Erwinia haradaeae]VFP86372.1 Hydroxyacylglutathione hydrolase GloB [Candidatus Erwinia haradaeae]